MDLTGAQSKYPGMIVRRCGRCGTAMGYPTLRVQYCYRNCSYCNLETRDDNKMFDPMHMTSNRRGNRLGLRRPRHVSRANSVFGRVEENGSVGSGRGLGHGRRRGRGGRRMSRVSEQAEAALGNVAVQIFAASWGHKRDPSRSVDITEDILRRQAAHPEQHLCLFASELKDPCTVWGDPAPNAKKVLIIRSAYCGRKWETKVFQRKSTAATRPGYLTRDVVLKPPKDPWIRILRATYGHRWDRKSQPHNVHASPPC